MFKRTIQQTLKLYAQFPVIAILGPRQSGKTTVAKEFFKKYRYTNLEDPVEQERAQRDPWKFLNDLDNENDHGVIIDEFQNFPDLLSYIQVRVDEVKRPGYYVLTGSQNYLANEAIGQSLAGRVGIVTLLPLSIHELAQNKLLTSLDELIFNGSYPRLYADHFTPQLLYPSYIRTYIERDIRQLKNIGDLGAFTKCMQLCAARVGNLLNIEDIAVNCGVDHRTISRWIALMEDSYILFRLQPYYENFNKRITKSPKLFFYDTGLVCSLLGLRSATEMSLSHWRGHLFENLIIADICKQYYNRGDRPPIYFWRDQNGRVEIDCLINRGGRLIPIEIKSGQSVMPDYFKGLELWNNITDTTPDGNYLVYGGTGIQRRTQATVVDWVSAGDIVENIEGQSVISDKTDNLPD